MVRIVRIEDDEPGLPTWELSAAYRLCPYCGQIRAAEAFEGGRCGVCTAELNDTEC
jgi:hypothetical protein